MFKTKNDLPEGVRAKMIRLLNVRLADAVDLQTRDSYGVPLPGVSSYARHGSKSSSFELSLGVGTRRDCCRSYRNMSRSPAPDVRSETNAIKRPSGLSAGVCSWAGELSPGSSINRWAT